MPLLIWPWFGGDNDTSHDGSLQGVLAELAAAEGMTGEVSMCEGATSELAGYAGVLSEVL